MGVPELGGLVLAVIRNGGLDVVGRVELWGLLGGLGRRRLGLVAGEYAAVLGLDRPDPALVVHFRPRVFPDPPDQLRVPARQASLLRRHLSL